MSIKAITLVEERTRAKGSNLGILRSIADYAKDDGRHAFPSPSTLAWKNRLTVRAAELILRKLVDDGEIWPQWNADERRLYLHIRCITDWARYALEGPLPEREKISLRVMSESFARRLMDRAYARSRRAEKVQWHDKKLQSRSTQREKSAPQREKTAREIPVSLSAHSTCNSHPLGSVQDPVIDPVSDPFNVQAGAAPRPAPQHDKTPEDPRANIGVITRLAHEVIDQIGQDHPDLVEALKSRCANHRIAYNSGVVAAAIDSAIFQRRRKASGA